MKNAILSLCFLFSGLLFAQKSVNATLADPDDHGFRGYDVILTGIEDACNGLVEVILDKVSKVA